MKLDWLKPRLLNVGITLVILALPIFKERVGETVFWHQPIVLLGIYIFMLELKPVLLMTGFCLLVYVIVSFFSKWVPDRLILLVDNQVVKPGDKSAKRPRHK